MARRLQAVKTAAWISGGIAVAGIGAGVIAAVAGYSAWRRRQYNLSGKTVLITGGSHGLGFALARAFLRQGARVALCARHEEDLRRAAERLNPPPAESEVFTVAADLQDAEAPAAVVEKVRERFGAIDVLVNNAGVMQIGPWDAMEEADYRQAMEVHFWAPLRLCRAVLPAMIARREGRIVNIASIGGLVAAPHMLPYTSSKFALVGFSRGLRSELLRHGVRVTTVCPWLMRTGAQENFTVRGAQGAAAVAWFAASGSVPLLAQNAHRAAGQIVAACRAGRSELVLTLPGKLVALTQGVAPRAMAGTLGLAAAMSRMGATPPASGGEDADAASPQRGPQEIYNAFTAKYIRPLLRRDAEEFNQPGPRPVGQR